MDKQHHIIIRKFFLLNGRDRAFLNYFLLGFALYTVFFCLTSAGKFNYVVGQSIQLLGIGLMIPSGFLLLRPGLESKNLTIVFSAYVIWLAGVVLRGLTLDYEVIKALLFEGWFGVMPYLAPLVLLFPKNFFLYKRMFDLIIVFCLVNLVLDTLFIPDLVSLASDNGNVVGKSMVEQFAKTISIPAGFILLTYPYHNKKRVFLALFTLVLNLMLGVFKARRGIIFMVSLPMMISYLIYLYQSQIKVKGTLMFLTIGLGLFLNTVALNMFEKSSLFKYLNERGLEDTRSGVEIRFYEDMGWQDWMAGKGMLGKYYCPEVPSPDDRTGYRKVIETDFLQIILKGGIISLLLLLVILIPAIWKGLFMSRNLLAKAAATWILLALINMYPSYINTFTLNYLLVWISVGICYSKTIRNMPDEVLKSYFTNAF